MKVLIFPPLKAGAGEVLSLRVSRGQMLKLQSQATELKIYGRAGGLLASVPALIRAIGEGQVMLVRRDAPVPESGGGVHRGCPVD